MKTKEKLPTFTQVCESLLRAPDIHEHAGMTCAIQWSCGLRLTLKKQYEPSLNLRYWFYPGQFVCDE